VLVLATLAALAALNVSGQSTYKNLGSGGCGVDQNNCHVRENAWWSGDPHALSLDALATNPNTVIYAQRFGIAAAEIYKGTSDCMRCHGTVVGGRESKDCEDGVSCEGCHGPGSGYKDVHQEKDGKKGAERSGYKKSLNAGLRDLKKVSLRAEQCASCHYTVDAKLIATGHPSGVKLNYAAGIKRIAATGRHWKRAITDTDTDAAPYEMVKASKGPPPAPPAPAPLVADGRVRADSAGVQVRVIYRTLPSSLIPSDDPWAIPGPNATKTVPLSPLVLPSDTASVDSLILVVRARLRAIYRAIRTTYGK
jgi:hypothetical protein